MIKRDSYVIHWRMSVSENKHKGPRVRTNQPGLCEGREEASVTEELRGKRRYRDARWEGGTAGQLRCSMGSGVGRVMDLEKNALKVELSTY